MPNATKSQNSDIPVRISGLISGILFKNEMALRDLLRILNMPIAAILPRRVASDEATRAITMVFLMALTSEFDMPPLKRLVYNFNEKPVQLPNTFVSENEKMAMMRIGVYSRANNSHKYPLANSFFAFINKGPTLTLP